MTKVRRNYGRRKYAKKSKSKVTKRGVTKIVKAAMRRTIESKWLYDHSTNNIDNVGHTIQVSIVPQGIGESQRIGDKYKISSIMLDFTLLADANSLALPLVQNPLTYRVVVVQAVNAATPPTPGDIYQDVTYETQSPYIQNSAFRKRFHVLADRRMIFTPKVNQVTAGVVSAFTNQLKRLRLNIRPKRSVMDCTAAPGVTANAIFVIAVTDNSSTNAPLLKQSLSWLIKYTDA